VLGVVGVLAGEVGLAVGLTEVLGLGVGVGFFVTLAEVMDLSCFAATACVVVTNGEHAAVATGAVSAWAARRPVRVPVGVRGRVAVA
jgi:hypothetical protein